MKRQLKIFLAGLFIVIPFAITVWAIWTAGGWLDGLGKAALRPIWERFEIERPKLENLHGLGAGLLIVGVYLIGLLTHFWAFRRVVELLEKLFEHVPGVKIIYESIRDLMKLFGSESRKMGKVVEYRRGDSEIGMLGILTNEQPTGAGEEGKVAVYFPLAYMIGGPVFFVPTEHLREVDMPVEQALRLCATAQVSGAGPLPTATGQVNQALSPQEGTDTKESRCASKAKPS